MKPRTQHWNFEIDGRPHNAEYQYSYWTGAKRMLVDGEVVKIVPGGVREMSSFGCSHTVDFEGHRLTFGRKAIKNMTWFSLEVDGREIEPVGGAEKMSYGMTIAMMVVAIIVGVALAMLKR